MQIRVHRKTEQRCRM